MLHSVCRLQVTSCCTNQRWFVFTPRCSERARTPRCWRPLPVPSRTFVPADGRLVPFLNKLRLCCWQKRGNIVCSLSMYPLSLPLYLFLSMGAISGPPCAWRRVSQWWQSCWLMATTAWFGQCPELWGTSPSTTATANCSVRIMLDHVFKRAAKHIIIQKWSNQTSLLLFILEMYSKSNIECNLASVCVL